MKNLSLAKRTFIGYGVAGIILIIFSLMGPSSVPPRPRN